MASDILSTMSSLKDETSDSDTSAQLLNDVHPSFNDPDADIMLVSCEGTKFYVHSRILSLASGWFCALPSLPQGPAERRPHMQESIYDLLPLSDSTRVVAAFLGIISHQPFPVLDTLELVDDLLHAGEKYDMPTVVSVVRLAIMSSPLLDACPIRVYGIASVRGWMVESKLASTKTI